MRVRLVLAFVAVVAVAIGIAEVVAERTATHEFDSYVGRVDTAYIETLAQNLGNYYATNGSWQGVESVFQALPQVPGRLQLQDNSGAVVGDTSPGRGPGPSGPSGWPGGPQVTPGPQTTPAGPGPGGAGSQGGSGPSATPTAAPGDGSGNPVAPGGAGGPSGPGGGDVTPRAPNNSSPRSESDTQSGLMEEVSAVSTTSGAAESDTAAGAEATPTPQAAQRIPIYVNGQQVGTLIVVAEATPTSSVSLSDQFFDRVRLALIVGGITGLVLAIAFVTFLVGGITRPLRRLTEAARRIASGDFSHRVAVTSPSEAAELATSFNRMAETLERDQETRRRLLSDIVHELRTPLSVIQGTAQGFLDGVIPADAAHAGIIRDEASLLNKLITDLRDIALAESGELRLERGPANLADLARQAASVVEPRAREKGIGLDVVAPEGLPPALVDSDRTLQIVGNLLENALRHTPSGGRVSVRLSGSRDGLLALQVADTGEGIPPEHLPHVFERFYRADPARPAGGTGLGLAIVKQLTEAQGGSVSVESEPGRGSVFTIIFPVAR
jgi:signal transduction histidine kinase